MNTIEQRVREIMDARFPLWANVLSEYYKGFEDGVRATLDRVMAEAGEK